LNRPLSELTRKIRRLISILCSSAYTPHPQVYAMHTDTQGFITELSTFRNPGPILSLSRAIVSVSSRSSLAADALLVVSHVCFEATPE